MVSLLSKTLLVIQATSALGLYNSDSADHSQFQEWKTLFNKTYESALHEAERFAIWAENKNKISTHNMNQASHGFSLALNEFGDMTTEEFVKSRNMVPFDSEKISRDGIKYMTPLNAEKKNRVDWRDHGLVTEVKNQGQCGSCWAFSTTGSIEGQLARDTGKLVSLSEQQLVDCSKKEGNMGCNGGLMDDGFKYVELKGIEKESEYSYLGQDEPCHYQKSKVVTTVKSFVDVPQGNEEALQSACAQNGPISVAIDASQFSFQFYSSGIYNEPNCSSTQLDHGVLVVGYDVEGGYYIVKNSWGPSWGMQGFLKMSLGKNNQCGIASSASYPVLPQEDKLASEEL